MNIGSSPPCVTALGGGGEGGGGGDRIFVMGGRSRRRGSSSSIGGGGGEVSSCGECDGEGAMVIERDSKGDKYKWNHIHTPLNFTGFPYSASYLLV
ncbi:hypothetical protein L1049_016481 [Liquidambar formosana]|uniref:Uncharacterized protein n=1 Tax=Liquidambar formosana TaxID=63359 RepID=A0AAP0RZB4_LIQFO